MKYQNNTSSSVLLPVKGNEIKPTSWLKFHLGDIKDVPEEAIEAAEVQGLTKVVEAAVSAEVPKMSSDDVGTKDDKKVEAETSSIGKTKVETKQKKGA